MTSHVDVDTLARIIQSAAETEIMPRFRALGPDDIREKTSAIDLVTEADEAAERFIKAECAEHFAGALFVGEESVAADPALLGKLGDADLAIVVDPIDGTANFATGLPVFGVMAAVVSKGQTVAGIIYDPLGRDFILAERGGGAFLDRKGERSRLKLAAPAPLAEMIALGAPSLFPQAQRREIFGSFAAFKTTANYRCAAYEYWSMAAGTAHLALFAKLMPWDHLPGVAIVEEAGAHVRRLDGSLYRPGHVDGGLLVAVDEASWSLAHQTVFGSGPAR
ncbi:inositol monophosphatase family protein [Aureimonas leprariae]|uniref:Inositol monophosphatase n=1 Tax=Plantimonas leprariae TaxID=2615207 RepID=A0A7V7PR14_9HYPH|nr:inositol monophosphatase [Aureimonas leprariae]KAB0680870.1 inositol monophosphatase [Aureimonas leprariae]